MRQPCRRERRGKTIDVDDRDAALSPERPIGEDGVQVDVMRPTALLIALVRGYQGLVSPFLPPTCRFYPSCSEYAIQAIRYYGPMQGLIKATWRLLRCHPLSHGGVDLPVSIGDDSL